MHDGGDHGRKMARGCVLLLVACCLLVLLLLLLLLGCFLIYETK